MRRPPAPQVIAAAAVITVLALAGCSSGSPSSVSGPPTSDPAATGSPGPAPSTSRPAPVRSPFASLAGFLAHRTGRITAAVYDARTGRTWVYHPGVLEDTASIVKVQIMGTALREAEMAGTALPPGQAALMTPMIEVSDNDAATQLLADVGGPASLRTFDRLAGLDRTFPSSVKLIPGTDLPGWGLTTTTAADQVTLVSRFAYPNAVLSSADRQYGLNLMEHVDPSENWGVSGGVPAGSTIALKNGWLPVAGSGWHINSIGWINGHGRNYVLAVLTDHDPSETYGIDTIEAIAKQVYAELEPRRPA
jgi:hypothetical protein